VKYLRKEARHEIMEDTPCLKGSFLMGKTKHLYNILFITKCQYIVYKYTFIYTYDKLIIIIIRRSIYNKELAMDLSLGSLYAEMAIDLSQLEKTRHDAIGKIGQLDNEVQTILKQTGGKLDEAMQKRIASLTQEMERYRSILSSLNTTSAELQKQMKEAGEVINNYLKQPLLALAESSVASFARFEQSMQNTFSVMGASKQEMKLLSDVAKEMGETTRFSASQAADALYSLGSAGQSATQAAASLKGVLQLAGATGSDLAFTSSTITSTLSQFNLDADKAGHIADVFAKAIGKSQANMGKLTYSMKYVGPVASGLGISLESTTAALMQLYNTGYGGEQAGTYLRQAFQKLASGTDDLKNKLQELGISYDEVNPQTQDFADVLDVLHEHNIGVTESIAIFGETSGGAMAKLIEGGGEAMRAMQGVLEASEGAAAEMQNIQNASFANTSAELASAMEAIQITIGEIITPFIDLVAKGLTQVLQTINGLPVGIKTFGVALLAIGASLGPLLSLKLAIPIITAKMAALNATMAANPIFIGVAAIAAVGAAAYSLWRQISSHNESLKDQVRRGIDEIRTLQQKAEEAGKKAQNIDDLMKQYEELRGKTELTKEEQEKYNSTLTRLTELVPGVITKIDETGQAYIDNIEAIKQARLSQLRLEQEEIQNTKILATATADIAQASLKQITDELAKAEVVYSQMQAKLKEFNAADATIDAKIKEFETGNKENQAKLEKLLKTARVGGQEVHEIDFSEKVGIDSTLEQDIAKYKKLRSGFLAEYIEDMKYYTSLNTQKLEAEADIRELQAITEKEKKISEIIEQEEKKRLKTKQEYIDEAEARRDDEVKRAQRKWDELRKGPSFQGAFDEESVQLDALQKKVEHLYSIPASAIEGGAITSADEKIKKDIDEINRLFNILESRKSKISAIKVKKEAVDDSLDARLKRLDDAHKAELELARQYGRNTLEIESEYRTQRSQMLSNELEERVRKLKKAGKSEKEAQAEALQGSTGGKDERASITLAEEMQQTNRLFESEFYKATQAYEQNMEKFHSLIARMNELKSLISQNEEKTDGRSSEDETRLLMMRKELADTEGDVAKLSSQLGQGYVSLNAINERIDSFYQKDHSGFITRIKDIAKAEADATDVIKKQVELGAVSPEKGVATIKKLHQEAAKATALVGVQLTASVLSVAQTLTNSIINAIETGQDGLQATMNVVGSLMGQVQNMLVDPISKAIVGSIMMVFSIIDTITNYARKKQKEREEKRKKELEERRKHEIETAKQIAGESAKEYVRQINNTKNSDFRGRFLQQLVQNARDKQIEDAIAKIGESNTKYYKTQSAFLEQGARGMDWETFKKKTAALLLRVREANDKEAKALLDQIYKQDASLYHAVNAGLKSNIKHRKIKGGKGEADEYEEIITEWKLDAATEVAAKKYYDDMKQRGAVSRLTLDEAIAEYARAAAEGDTKRMKQWEKIVEKGSKDALKEKGIDPKEMDALHTYVKGWTDMVVNAIKSGDKSTIGITFKEMLRGAILDKLKGRIFDAEIQKIIDKYGETGDESYLHEAIEKTNNSVKVFTEQAKQLTQGIGLANSEMDEHIKNWSGMKTAIADSLTSSLGDAAFNADWKSFKNAFAGEMRKAIIEAVVANAGVKKKVSDLIQSIMQDGKITTDEIEGAIGSLQQMYDDVEGELEAFNQALTRLQGDGLDIKHETNGNIIQKLSGADRDFLAESFRENFKTLAESLQGMTVDLKEIHQAQITVLQATLNVNTVYIQASDNMSLKEFIGELIEQARQAG